MNGAVIVVVLVTIGALAQLYLNLSFAMRIDRLENAKTPDEQKDLAEIERLQDLWEEQSRVIRQIAAERDEALARVAELERRR